MLDYASYSPPSAEIDVLYQDDDILAVNKPSGLLSVPGRGDGKQDCLLSRVSKSFPQVRVVHRLDMLTSGVILLARTAMSQRWLAKLFEHRQITKTYLAIVSGRLCSTHGSIDAPLICDWPNRPKQKVDYVQGKPAHTEYHMLSWDPASSTSRVKLLPFTGRSHQLRVHMASLGHPILGDPLYAKESIYLQSPRLLLHALSIQFVHPETQRPIRITSQAPF